MLHISSQITFYKYIRSYKKFVYTLGLILISRISAFHICSPYNATSNSFRVSQISVKDCVKAPDQRLGAGDWQWFVLLSQRVVWCVIVLWLLFQYNTPLFVIGDPLCIFLPNSWAETNMVLTGSISFSIFLLPPSRAKCLQDSEFIVSLSCTDYHGVLVRFCCSAIHNSLHFFQFWPWP